jgi:hypothetical protein
MTTFSGKVKKLVSKEIMIQNKPFIKNEISIDVNGETKTVLKFTKPETTFALETGTLVQVTGDEQEDKYGNITFKVNSKPESFVLLDQNNKPKETHTKVADSGGAGTSTNGKGANSTSGTTSISSWNGDGAKRGNALTNAVTILLHNKKQSIITVQDETTLLELARMVYRVSTTLETPETTSSTKATKDFNNEISPFD